jgi:hypothetical protein
LVVKEEGDQQPAKAAIAVEKRVDGLELHMGQRRLEQYRSRLGLVVKETFELAHAFEHVFSGRRNKGRIARPGAADPVLAAPEFARRKAAASPLVEKHPVNLSYQPQRQRQPALQESLAVVKSRNVVADFPHVIKRDAGFLVQLVEQQVRQ